MNLVRVVVIEPLKRPEIRAIVPQLAILRALVGGNIEHVTLDGPARIGLYCNEDGKGLDLPWCRDLPNGDNIRGTFLVAKADADGEMISLSEAEAAEWARRCTPMMMDVP